MIMRIVYNSVMIAAFAHNDKNKFEICINKMQATETAKSSSKIEMSGINVFMKFQKDNFIEILISIIIVIIKLMLNDMVTVSARISMLRNARAMQVAEIVTTVDMQQLTKHRFVSPSALKIAPDVPVIICAQIPRLIYRKHWTAECHCAPYKIRMISLLQQKQIAEISKPSNDRTFDILMNCL